jgi:hypothetical protein
MTFGAAADSAAGKMGIRTSMDLADVERGTKVVLRDGGVGVVVAQRTSPDGSGQSALQVKLADEGRMVLISDPAEIAQLAPSTA